MLVLSWGFVAGMVGCGGPPPPPVSIQMSVTPATSDGYIFPDTLTATVLNTQQNAVNWQVTCSMAQCGSLTTSATTGAGGATASSASGQPIYYYPAGPGVITVTFTATLVADPTKTATMTITRGDPTVMSFSAIPTSLAVGSKGAVTALLTSDPIEINILEKLGYTWTVTCASKDCGTFSNSPSIPIGNSYSSDFTTAWGITPYIQYNAPATVPSGGIVTIKVTLNAQSTPDPTQPSATSTITITQ